MVTSVIHVPPAAWADAEPAIAMAEKSDANAMVNIFILFLLCCKPVIKRTKLSSSLRIGERIAHGVYAVYMVGRCTLYTWQEGLSLIESPPPPGAYWIEREPRP
jgi:hypothetical protein